MPNTTVRAAAEGMPAINRRRMLLGLAAASTAAAAITVASAAGCAPAEHPDAELFRLEQEMEAAHARMNQQAKVCERIDRKCDKLFPPNPPKWEEPDMPEDVRVAFQAMTVKDMGTNNRPAIYAAWSNEVKEQKAANNGLHQAYHAKWEEINRESGLDAAEDAFGVRNNELWELGLRIFATPANTLEGMVVKLRAADRMDLQSFADENEGFLSIAADIRRLASGGTA
ncbi:hypothetical protein [Mesorhizobium mediterraneum]|uniref:hypothetical protein n=1 Tax=Mesorhizobium mediterraneum TaxID=43617 RepID=UPI0017868BA0|nr:hypothetical protein [Mesorhizobium mediterraneum]